MAKLFIDIETYSSTDLKVSGAYKYIESDDFEILIVGYALDNGPVKIVDLLGGEELPAEFITALQDPTCLKVAHNAVFERLSFRRMGYDIPPEQWYCTSVKAAYCGLPLSLGEVSKALNLSDKKLDTGKMLIKYFSNPCKPTKTNGFRERNYPCDAPEKWEMYKEYNMYDVLAEREIYQLLEKYEIPEVERRLYALDQRINDRGILVDRNLAESAIYVDTEVTEALMQEAQNKTGLANPNSTVQVTKWIYEKTGKTIKSLAKTVMDDVMAELKDYPEIIDLLNIKKKLSKTSIKKYYAMLNCAMKDDRVRGTFQFYGANRTGRWAGRLLQLQNLSKNKVKDISLARDLIRQRDWEAVEMLFGDVPDILSQLVRTALIAPRGYVFSVADFSAIEARVVSWLANEKWRMDVFAGDGKIYEATGAKMFGVPISAITKGSALRDKSKISELALGYGGSVGALAKMGGERMGLSQVEMASLVRKWRMANPAIVELWEELDNSAKECIRYRREVVCTCRNIIFNCDGEYMTVKLPSGRSLYYREPSIKSKQIGKSKMPTASVFYKSVVQETKQWGEVDTYGGKLTENLVQAIARDLLGHSMLKLDEAGYKPICHIHDECIIEVPDYRAEADYAEMVKLMSEPPLWAQDLPLRADGYITPFYLKD